MEHVIVIPSYKPGQTLIRLIDELLELGAPRLVVVDDGSGHGYAGIFARLETYENTVVLRHTENKGKGAALKTAFAYCLKNCAEYPGVVIADDDGQHAASDIAAVSQAMTRDAGCLVVGVRALDKGNMPGSSFVGNKAVNVVFDALHNVRLSDTQCGLRGIPMCRLDWVSKVGGNRYEYGLNMLIQAGRRGVEVRQIPIKTLPPGEAAGERYKPVRDTLRIAGMLAGSLMWYSAGSAGSIVIDVGCFFALNTFVFVRMETAVRLLAATVAARVLSSIWDFMAHRMFFQQTGRNTGRSVFRYYCLWFGQMLTSYTLLFAGSLIFNVNDSVIKGAVDMALAVVSYQIQLRWVFADRRSKAFYGALFSVLRKLLRLFLQKQRITGDRPQEAVVFVGHHQNLKGVIYNAIWLDIPSRIWILDVFCDRRSCFRHYYGYTFTRRMGWSKPRAYVMSALLSCLVPALARSMGAIPVHRGSAVNIRKTFELSLDALLKGESLMIFPDVDYAGTSSRMGKMYTGFLHLEEEYFERTCRHLRFVPLKADFEKRTIRIGKPSAFMDGEGLSTGKKRIRDELRNELNTDF